MTLLCYPERRDNRLGGRISVFRCSIISIDGELYGELSGKLAKAAKMFGSVNESLSVETCRCVYLSTVVATLLYDSETWAVKAD